MSFNALYLSRFSDTVPMDDALSQNKEFVCRGNDYERLEAFQQRMLSEFPHAIAMQHANLPDQTIHQADAQCIPKEQINNLICIPFVNLKFESLNSMRRQFVFS